MKTQYHELGAELYDKIGAFAREKYVYNQIKKNKHLFNEQEIADAQRYMNDLMDRRARIKVGLEPDRGFLPNKSN